MPAMNPNLSPFPQHIAAILESVYHSPVSDSKTEAGIGVPREAVMSRDTCTSERGIFSSELDSYARPCLARADGLVARTGEPQGSPVLPRYANPVRAASQLALEGGVAQPKSEVSAMSQNQTTGTTVAITAPDLDIIDGQITTTSNQVAQHFNKRHTHVLRAIKNLLKELPEGYEPNFGLIQIETDLGAGRTRQDPAYRITRDGFALLAMGFTGKEALQWKVAYISAFKKMEAELLKQQAPRVAYSANPDNALTKEEADTLRQMVEGTAKKLSSNSKVQGKFIMQAWSKLKSHFKVGYRAIPRHELTEAISIITRHTVDWEVLDTAPAPQQMALPDESIDVAALLLTGQASPKPLTAAQHALIDQCAGRLVGEAYPLIRAHLERRVAWGTNAAPQHDTGATQAILDNATLGNCLAHHYRTELQAAQMLMQAVRQRLDMALGSISQPLGLIH